MLRAAHRPMPTHAQQDVSSIASIPRIPSSDDMDSIALAPCVSLPAMAAGRLTQRALSSSLRFPIEDLSEAFSAPDCESDDGDYDSSGAVLDAAAITPPSTATCQAVQTMAIGQAAIRSSRPGEAVSDAVPVACPPQTGNLNRSNSGRHARVAADPGHAPSRLAAQRGVEEPAAGMPSPATLALAAAAAEMRSWDHRRTRLKGLGLSNAGQNHQHAPRLGGTQGPDPGEREPPARVQRSQSREVGAGAGGARFTQPLPRCGSLGRAPSESKACSLPFDSLEAAGSGDVEAQVLVISNGLPGGCSGIGATATALHLDLPGVLSAQLPNLKPLEVEGMDAQCLWDIVPDEGSGDGGPAPQRHVHAVPVRSGVGQSKGPHEGVQNGHVRRLSKGVSPPLQAAMGLAGNPEGDGAILVASPVLAAARPVQQPRGIVRSVSEDQRQHLATHADKLYMEDFLQNGTASGPSSLNGSPARGSPPVAPVRRPGPLLQGQGSGPQGAALRGRAGERSRLQVGRLSAASQAQHSNVFGPQHQAFTGQRTAAAPPRVSASTSHERPGPVLHSASLKAPRPSLQDLYPCAGVGDGAGALGGLRAPVGGGTQAMPVVRHARSLSPASWKRDVPAIHIPYNAFDSPRSPPKPIMVGPPVKHQSQSQGRRR